jgi:hypothetical protein
VKRVVATEGDVVEVSRLIVYVKIRVLEAGGFNDCP